MKLLLISPLPPPVGGIATWSVNLLNYLSKKPEGYEILHQNSAISGSRITKHNAVTRLYFGIKESRAIIRKLKVNIKNLRPDLIHLTSSASLALVKDFYILRIAKKNNIPIIVHWRFGRISELSKRRNWEWKLLYYVIRKSSISIVIDEKSFRTLRDSGFENVLNIPNPISFDLEQKAKELTLKTGIRRKGRIIYVGHITKGKGVIELVEACAQLPLVEELILIGPFEMNIKSKLLAIANGKNEGFWLKMLGTLNQEKVLDQMEESPVLVLPSYTEGFPNVVIEAMGMGCAVIASDVGAIPEMLNIFSDKPCGICVPVKDTEKLKDAIEMMLNNPGLAESMGINGHDRVLNNYTIEKIVKEYKSVWGNAAIKSSINY